MKPLVLVDSREYSNYPRIASRLQELCDIVVEELEAGDYYFPQGEVIVERKEIKDLANSVREGRLWTQLEKLKNCNAKPILLIEGSPALLVEKGRGWSRESVAGILLSCCLDWGIPMVYSPSYLWTSIYLTGIALRQKGKEIHPLRVKEKAETMEEKARRVLEGIEGIGPVHATNLLKSLGSVRAVCNSPIEVLMQAEGIGEKRAKTIYEVVNYDCRGST
jgi:Fanconi anemia group M protein